MCTAHTDRNFTIRSSGPRAGASQAAILSTGTSCPLRCNGRNTPCSRHASSTLAASRHNIRVGCAPACALRFVRSLFGPRQSPAHFTPLSDKSNRCTSWPLPSSSLLRMQAPPQRRLYRPILVKRLLSTPPSRRVRPRPVSLKSLSARRSQPLSSPPVCSHNSWRVSAEAG